MCSLARPSALGFEAATAFLDRRRGVAAPAVCCVMERREPARRAGAEASSPAARTQLKRARESFLDGKVAASRKSTAGEAVPIIPARGQQRLQERMREELDAVRALHRTAVLLCRGDGRSGAAKGGARFSAAGLRRREKPTEVAAKRRKTSPSESARTELEQHKEAVKLLQRPAQCAAPPSAKEDAHKRRRMVEEKEIARAREECRQQVLEAERAALPDELEELGIAPFEYVVTRTRRQARCGGPK